MFGNEHLRMLSNVHLRMLGNVHLRMLGNVHLRISVEVLVRIRHFMIRTSFCLNEEKITSRYTLVLRYSESFFSLPKRSYD
jgi:hypothetical protein